MDHNPITDHLQREFDKIPVALEQEYLQFLRLIKPKTPEDIFRRLMFAILSVQMSWESNVALYQALKDLHWTCLSQDYVEELIRPTGSGLYKVKAKFVWEAAQQFFQADWLEFLANPDSTVRDKLMKRFVGLGMAKSSFTCEMCFWDLERHVCLDRHMLRRCFKHPPDRITDAVYRDYELQFCICAWARGMNPAAARLTYWDLYQGRTSSYYWSKVFLDR